MTTPRDQCAKQRGRPIRPAGAVRIVPDAGRWYLYDGAGTRLTFYGTEAEAQAAAEVWRALSDMPSEPCPDPLAHVMLRSPIQPLADLFRTAINIADVVSPDRGEIAARLLADPKHADALRAFVAAVNKMETAP